MREICLIAVLCLAASALSAGELIGHWRFNESVGQELKDAGGKYDAALVRTGESAKWIPGRSGYAVHFSGNHTKWNTSGAAVFKMPPDTFTKPFSIEMWLKTDAEAPPRKFKDLIGNGSDRGPGFRITYYYSGIQLRSGNGAEATVLGTNSATVIVPSNSWWQLVVTYDGAEAKIFINGEEKSSGPILLTPAKSSNVTIGAYGRGGAYPMCGACDELKIYNYPLSKTEVIQNYLKGM